MSTIGSFILFLVTHIGVRDGGRGSGAGGGGGGGAAATPTLILSHRCANNGQRGLTYKACKEHNIGPIGYILYYMIQFDSTFDFLIAGVVAV